MADSQRFYSDEEAHQILNLASKDLPLNGMSRDELVSAAREMGISQDAIERAEGELRRQQDERQREDGDRVLRAKFHRHLRAKFWGSVSSHLGGIAFFVGLWFLTGAGYFWPAWILFFIVLGIISDLADVMFDSTRRQRKFEKWKANQQDPSIISEGFSPSMGLTFRCNGHRRRERNESHIS